MAQDGVSALVAGKPDGEKFVVDFMHGGVKKKMELMSDSRAPVYQGIIEHLVAVFVDDLLQDEDIQREIDASGERGAVMNVVAQLPMLGMMIANVGLEQAIPMFGMMIAMELDLEKNPNRKRFVDLLGRKLD